MTRAHRHLPRGAAATLTAAALGVALALTFGPVTASSAAARAAGTGPAAGASRTGIPSTIRACPRAVTGSATCLATFRSSAAAQRAGVPANIAAPAGTATPGTASAATAGVAPPKTGYGPADIKSVYALDTTRGAGQTVAIIDAFDNPNADSDLAAFRSAYKLPPCATSNGCLRKLNQRGGPTPPPADAGWGVEIALDLQAVSAACPRCRILLIEADSPNVDDLGAAVNRAVSLGAKIVSNSYGGPEYNGVLALANKYYHHAGVATVASSGDTGFGPVSFPASGSDVIAVGGTRVVRTKTGWKHSAWTGAGSGCSAWITKPSWQHDPNCLQRTTSDISALADPDTGFAVYDTYALDQFGLAPGWLVVGGTSLAAPLIAGMIGLAGNPASLSTARYTYNHRGDLRDVVGGSNAGFQDCGGDYLCTALPGYDGPTGLGTPRGLAAL